MDVAMRLKLNAVGTEGSPPRAEGLPMIETTGQHRVLPMVDHLMAQHGDELLLCRELSRQLDGVAVGRVIGPTLGAVDEREIAFGQV